MSQIKYIFVDGYNVIHSWQQLKALKDESLENYVYKGILEKLERIRRNL